MGTIACGTGRSGVATRHGEMWGRSGPWVETHGYYPSPLRGGGKGIFHGFALKPWESATHLIASNRKRLAFTACVA